ncbi:hypothetical protein LTR66_016973, partial [Elasticomyces elasticus]
INDAAKLRIIRIGEHESRSYVLQNICVRSGRVVEAGCVNENNFVSFIIGSNKLWFERTGRQAISDLNVI